MTILNIQNIFFLDTAVIIILIIIAYLSKRLGEALKKPAFYKLFYTGAACIIAAAILNAIAINSLFSFSSNAAHIISMAMRFVAGFISVFACLQYWKWLFTEIFKN